MSKNIVLVGFMGTGKSEVGILLAEKLKRRFIDTDKIIEEKEKDRIARIFQVKGEEYFREVEEQIIEEVSKYENCVIATGGGALIREKNYLNLKRNGVLICLTASPEEIYKRTLPKKDRPLLMRSKNVIETIKELLEIRKPYYSKADYTIDTTNKKIEAVVEEIIKIIEKNGEN
ncbi:MAG: shikimate kinase [Candidatus Omnitrophica bacterium]|nr:shikimate kinase [Candidatus Omnitrophota bacterium]MCM8803109.1 shikimate kinase [Candidatus Omnitrophota bacterium]